jgi:hypothetical protein
MFLSNRRLDLVRGDLLAGLDQAGDQEDLLLLVEDLVLGPAGREGDGGRGDADAADDADHGGEADRVAGTIAAIVRHPPLDVGLTMK